MKNTLAKRIAAGVVAAAVVVTAGLATSADAKPRLKVSTLVFDFNTAGAVASDFSTLTGMGSVSQSANGGVADSGAISVDDMTANTQAIFQPNANYSMGPVGASYTFSGFMKSEGNGGYAGFGFTALDNTAGNVASGYYRPADAIGLSFHGGGWILHNGATDIDGSWNDPNAVKPYDLVNYNDLIGNTTNSPDSWYKLVFKLSRTSTTEFTARWEVWPANADGTLRTSEAAAIFEKTNLVNAAISSSTELSSYIMFDGKRASKFDNFSTTVIGSKITGAPAGNVTTEPDPEPTSTTTKVKATGFWGDSSFINGKVAKRIKAALKTPGTITAVTCTGNTVGTKATAADKALALARAKAACAYVKTIAKSATVKSVANPASGTSSKERSVVIAVTR